ncbi:Serpin domain [Cinara cedri]|uniref:Serpin domain n=1 Tax=Cinara cedri TaxID=506608 RepID=A0A5E4MLB4_9HEMI|nr:Serpin domain [Cinara cedri]
MKIIWTIPILILHIYRITGSHLKDEYNQYSFYQKRPLSPRPLDAMTDLTNDLGVCVLRIIAAGGTVGNIAFSPFGLMAVSVLLYEGSSGYSALQIKQSLNLPWEILAVRIGVRDLNRYLKTYFKSDGFLNGLTMNREEVCLRPQFKRVLRLYGFDNPNNFLVDSCPESSTTTTTTTQPMPPMSVTTQGTVLTEMTPTSQVIQISTNITNGSASEISTVATEFPAKVTYLGDASFTISNINTNVTSTSPSMNSQTDTMVVDIETQPHIKPIESSTNQQRITDSINEEESKSSNEKEFISKKPNESITNISPPMNFQTDTMMTFVDSTTPIISNTMTAAATVTQVMSTDYNRNTINSKAEKIIDMTSVLDTNPIETTTSTTQLYKKTTDITFNTTSNVDILDAGNATILPSNSYVTSTKNEPDNTIVPSTENTLQTISDETTNMMNDQYALLENMVETMMSTTNKLTTGTDETTQSMDTSSTIEIIPSTKTIFNDDSSATKEFQTNIIPITSTDQTTSFTKFELNNNDIITVNENVLSTTVNSTNVTENEIINEAESNQHFQIAFLDKKTARSMASNDLPNFNVEFVVRKEDTQIDCNRTQKKNVIKPDRILTEYPNNSGISVKLRESKKRRRRYLEQYHGYNSNLFTGYRTEYGPPSGWIDRSSDPFFESKNFFNAGYRRIPYFTYTAVLPFGFIFELKSRVIEIPLDDPKYTLMILMPNHPDGLSELLLLLPTMSLRNIHNSLKPTAVHATIPTFRYTAKVDLTSALQQIGIQDVFYRYRADLSFMSPDARLFVNSLHQVVSVTAKKYNTPPIYEIQRKYVEHNFVVSKPFVYFVIDLHTKVSLIAGVITDPLASPIWI